MGFSLRLSNSTDLERLKFISAQARERYRSLPEFGHVAEAPALTADRFEICRVEVAVDDASAEVVGFVAMRPLDGLLYLDNISVEAESSGRGIGKALLTQARLYAASLNVPGTMLTTFRKPAWNGPWFRRHGYVPIPSDRIDRGLGEVLERQWRTLDPVTRETLWQPL